MSFMSDPHIKSATRLIKWNKNRLKHEKTGKKENKMCIQQKLCGENKKKSTKKTTIYKIYTSDVLLMKAKLLFQSKETAEKKYSFFITFNS